MREILIKYRQRIYRKSMVQWIYEKIINLIGYQENADEISIQGTTTKKNRLGLP